MRLARLDAVLEDPALASPAPQLDQVRVEEGDPGFGRPMGQRPCLGSTFERPSGECLDDGPGQLGASRYTRIVLSDL
jgi:hypothetical protein